jgi:hypothetical protein
MAILVARTGLGQPITAGIIGGLIFAAFEVLAAVAMMGPEAAFMPLRMIGGIVLGEQALDPGYPLFTAALAGLIVHMVLSVMFAIVFAAIVPRSTRSTAALAILGIGFGIALWIVNFFVIAPFAGWTWFPERTDPFIQAVAHALFFGLPVGWYIARVRPMVTAAF